MIVLILLWEQMLKLWWGKTRKGYGNDHGKLWNFKIFKDKRREPLRKFCHLTNWRQSVLCVCPLIDDELHHNIVKAAIEPRAAGEQFRSKLTRPVTWAFCMRMREISGIIWVRRHLLFLNALGRVFNGWCTLWERSCQERCTIITSLHTFLTLQIQ